MVFFSVHTTFSVIFSAIIFKWNDQVTERCRGRDIMYQTRRVPKNDLATKIDHCLQYLAHTIDFPSSLSTEISKLFVLASLDILVCKNKAWPELTGQRVRSLRIHLQALHHCCEFPYSLDMFVIFFVNQKKKLAI